MEMVGQDDPGVDRKRPGLAYRSHGTPQKIDMPCQQVVAMPLQEIDREKETPSGDAVATVVGNALHSFSVSRSSEKRIYHTAGYATL